MRDPYEVLGVKRGASLDEIKAAYRRRSKATHPDMPGGSAAPFIELVEAYQRILEELKSGYEQRRYQQQRQSHRQAHERQDAPRPEQEAEWSDVPPHGQHRSTTEDDRLWEKYYRDIDEELENLRRAAEDRENRLRTMRARAWERGHRTAWLVLTWQDLNRFLRSLLRSGLKGFALLVAALMGVGSLLAQINFASAIIVTGSLIGYFIAVALKNDKGGVISAGLLLFGLMTLWLPPVRAALVGYPMATISVLLCLALIFKFARELGAVGFLTAAVLGAFVIGAIVNDVERQQMAAVPTTPLPQAPLPPPPSAVMPSQSRPLPPAAVPRTTASLPTPPPRPEPLTLRATRGAVLKFVAGVPYILEIRAGQTTTLQARAGQIALHAGDQQIGDCRVSLDLSMPAGNPPFHRIEHTLRACGRDAIVDVIEAR